MKKIILVGFLMFAMQANVFSFNLNLAKMLQDTLSSYVAALSNIKGMSASVYYPGQGIWQGTAGVSYAGNPITSDMEFGIASNSKVFVAAAILKLVENNKLQLNDSLHKWLPSFRNVDSNITIRQLLNHTSGVSESISIPPYMDTIMKNPTRVFTPEEVLSWLGAAKFSPGTSFYYSNSNYVLAGMVVKSATGFHISRIIRDSLLTPLGLDSTFYDVEETVLGTVAHRWYNGVDYHDTSRVGLNSAGGAAGSIFSTSAEMAQWYHGLFSGQILNSNSLAELTRFVDIQSSYKYGLGLQEQTFFGHNTWGHGGSTWGYKSRMVHDPVTGAVVCGLTNSFPSGVDGVTLLLYKILVDRLPAVAGSITGQVNVCQGYSATYSVPAIANATTYIWSLPDGVSGTSETNTIRVTFSDSAKSGNITVFGRNNFGDGLSSFFPVKVNPVYRVSENFEICEGDSFQWHGKSFTKSGTYPAHYTTVNGCDSNFTLKLKVNPNYRFNEEKSICQGDTFKWHGKSYTSSNIYTANYITNDGCDSIYTLKLTVNSVFKFNEEKSICDGESYLWQGTEYSIAGNYQKKYNSLSGCDSIYELNLLVEKIPTRVSLNGTTASADSYQWLDCNNNFLSVPNANERSFKPSVSGDYAALLTRGECSDTSECLRIVITDVADQFVKNNWVIISPNPASDFIEIATSVGAQRAVPEQIRIFNVFCQEFLLHSQFSIVNSQLDNSSSHYSLLNTQYSAKINVSALPAGVYFVRVGDKMQKFIKI